MQPFSYYRGDVKALFELELTGLTAVSGSNQTGKTGIASGVRLALTGTHPMLGKKAHMLARLIPHGAVRAEAVLQGPEGNAEWCIQQTQSGGHTVTADFTGALAVYEKRRGAIIVSDVAAQMMAGHTAKGREELIRRFGADTAVSLDLPDGLSTDQEAIWREAVQVTKRELKDASSAEILGGMTAWCRTAVSAARNKVEALAGETRGTVAAKTKPLSGKTLAQLEAELAAVDEWDAQDADRREASMWESGLAARRKEFDRLKAEETAARTEYISLGGSKDGVGPTATVRDEAARRLHRVQAFVALARELAKTRGTACPFCAASHPNASIWEARLLILLPIEAERTRALKAADDLASAEMRLGSLHGSVMATTADIESVEKKLTNIKKRLTAQAPARPRQEVTDDLYALKQATAVASKVYAQAGASKTEKQRVDDLKVVADVAASKQIEALVACREQALERVNAFMPPGIRAALEIGEDAVVWGVTPDGRTNMSPAGAGSGFEEGSLMVALGAATATTDLRMVVLDDDYLGRFDTRRIVDFMTVLENAVSRGQLTQALLFWNRPHELLEAKAWRHLVLPEV